MSQHEPQATESSRKNYLPYALFIGLAFAAGIGLAWGVQQWRTTQQESAQALATYGGDFMLEAPWGASGLPDYRGKLVMAYFGFTSCPDVCPTSLGIMKAAMNQLSEQEQAQIRGLFISVDPERDLPQRTEEYAQYFHANFHGLSGTADAIAHVAKQYGVLYRKIPTPESAMAYTLDHSSVIYIIDAKGVLREKVKHGTTAAELATTLRQYL
ncbi:MAG: SCO family protein [Thiolinea sp.]